MVLLNGVMEAVLAGSVPVCRYILHQVVLSNELEHINMAFAAELLKKDIALLWQELLKVAIPQVLIAELSQVIFQVCQVAYLDDGVKMELYLLVCLLLRHC